MHQAEARVRAMPRLAEAVASRFGAVDGVTAITLAGSHSAGRADEHSDIDLYVYAREAIPLTARAAIAREFSGYDQVDTAVWEPGDEWVDSGTGIVVDIVYRTSQWIEARLDDVLIKHRASVGHSTCFWHNVLASVPAHDPEDGSRGSKRMRAARTPSRCARRSWPRTTGRCGRAPPRSCTTWRPPRRAAMA